MDLHVLSAAAGLVRFDLPTLTAYCEPDEQEIATILARYPALFARRCQRHRAGGADEVWQVTDEECLRQTIATMAPNDTPTASQIDIFDRGHDMLVLAEKLLLNSTTESDLSRRRSTVLRARTYLHRVSEMITIAQPDCPEHVRITARLRLGEFLAELNLADLNQKSVSSERLKDGLLTAAEGLDHVPANYALKLRTHFGYVVARAFRRRWSLDEALARLAPMASKQITSDSARAAGASASIMNALVSEATSQPFTEAKRLVLSV